VTDHRDYDDIQYLRGKVDAIADDVSLGRSILQATIPRHEEDIKDLKARLSLHEVKHAKQEGFFAAGKLALVGVASTVSLSIKWAAENWTDIFGATK
jgi:hypothetical protein